MEIPFARVNVNLELSVNEEFVAYGTVVKILVILKCPRANGCGLIQKLEPVIGKGCVCSNVLAINFFFHNLTC